MLAAREVYQILKDVAMEVRSLRRVGERVVDVDGWVISFAYEDDALHHCASCQAPDGRVGSLDTWQRFGTDPVSFLSAWEHRHVQRLLAELEASVS
jgi:hypothetical protein